MVELNPILTRESRARWRGRAFTLLLSGVALLALLMVLAYHSATQNTWGYRHRGDIASAMGAQIFLKLTYYQVIGWMLLAPALTATAIAAERERGLLEGLQLSALAPGQIVRGKLYAVLTFIALLLLATQPVMAICFLLGGVSPREFLSALGLIFCTALGGASLGLCVSAWSRRAAQSARSTLGLALLWGFGSLFALGLVYVPRIRATPGAPDLLLHIALLNPAFALSMQQVSFARIIAAMAGFFLLPANPILTSELLLIGSSLLLLLSCAAAVRRPFADQSWVEIGPATPDEAVEQTPEQPKQPALQSKARRGRRPLAMARWIRCSNPVLQRDLRAKFMLRRLGPLALVFQCLSLGVMAYGYFWLLKMAFDWPDYSEGMWGTLAIGVLFALIVSPAMAGATAITREREGGTWEGVCLSLLSPLDIVTGKQLAAFGGSLPIALLLLPFVPACTRGGITAKQVLLTFALLMATAWFAAAWGLLISNRCRRTAAATAWTVGSLFMLLALGPPLVAWTIGELFGYSYATNSVGEFLWSLHPFGALTYLLGIPGAKHPLQLALRGTLFLFAFGCVLLMLLTGALRQRAGREE